MSDKLNLTKERGRGKFAVSKYVTEKIFKYPEESKKEVVICKAHACGMSTEQTGFVSSVPSQPMDDIEEYRKELHQRIAQSMGTPRYMLHKEIPKRCIVCDFDISTTNHESHGIELCWKHDCECRRVYQDRMFSDTEKVRSEIIKEVNQNRGA